MKKEPMKTLSFRVPVTFYEKVVKYCEKHCMTQSEFLRLCVRSFIQQ